MNVGAYLPPSYPAEKRHSFGRVTDEADPRVDREAPLSGCGARCDLSLWPRVIEVYTRTPRSLLFVAPGNYFLYLED